MPNLPGLDADVFFGDPGKPLPDWRAETPDDEGDEDDDDEPTTDQLKAVHGMLGFDPNEIDDVKLSDVQEGSAETGSADPEVESILDKVTPAAAAAFAELRARLDALVKKKRQTK